MYKENQFSRNYRLLLLSTIFYSLISLPTWSTLVVIGSMLPLLLQRYNLIKKFKLNLFILYFLICNIVLLLGNPNEKPSLIIQSIFCLYLACSLLKKYSLIHSQVTLVLCFVVFALSSKSEILSLNLAISLVFYSLITWTLFLNQNIDTSIIDFRKLEKPY